VQILTPQPPTPEYFAIQVASTKAPPRKRRGAFLFLLRLKFASATLLQIVVTLQRREPLLHKRRRFPSGIRKPTLA
ncbi:hypothetical protein, partial [Rhizobium sp. BK196]|uniref:hypothetical protein n=1 Tax=Rhizobium sp. BK196 TaxID=2587073 RepID=UPI001AEDF281